MSEVRLIDANALKNEIERTFDMQDLYLPVHFLDLIDNAPTVPQVTVFAENASKEEIEDFKQELEKVLERPQGEWIFLKANEEQTDGYECSVCKSTYHTRVPYFSEFNFCPNCGADMRGGAK